MKRVDLGEHIRAYYEAAGPSPEVLDRLFAATRADGSESRPGSGDARTIDREPDGRNRPLRPILTRALWAAILVVAVGGGVLIQSWLTAGVTARHVADEIVMNHVKNLNVEIPATTWNELRAGLDKLDFALMDSPRLEDREFRLQGGRYCSIQGKLAAQIRLLDRGGNRLTLYQTATTSDLESLDRTLSTSGVEVEMWNERGLFFGLARAASDLAH